MALDEYLARVFAAQLSLEEEHVDDGEKEDVDDNKEQVARVVLIKSCLVKRNENFRNLMQENLSDFLDDVFS